jgi:hypothetical protein
MVGSLDCPFHTFIEEKRDAMSIIINDYDVTLAVITSRALLLEAHTNDERAVLVWEPIQYFLDTLAITTPSKLTCFASETYQFPEKSIGRCINLYLVNDQHEVIKLGTAFTKQAAMDDKAAEIERLKIIAPDQAELLAQRDHTTIIRDRCFCKIPMQGEKLDEAEITEATRCYLRTFASSLADLSITWLPTETGAELDKKIWREAERTAEPSSQEERRRSIIEDEV